jgi:hypothetical protein
VTTKRRPGRRTIIGILVLFALAAGVLAWRASWIAHRLLRSWTTATTREESGDVYRLAVGRVKFNLALRRVTVDSMRVSTIDSTNALRSSPLATMDLTFRDCTISGVQLVTLMRNRGLVADRFGCRSVTAGFVVPRGAPDTATRQEAPGAMHRFQRSIVMPPFAPRVQIADINFPDVAIDFLVQRHRASDAHVTLEQFRWRMADFVMDPTDSSAASRPMFSKSIEFGADNIAVYPDSNLVLRIESVAASLTDSTLRVRGFTLAPVLGRTAFAKARPYRRAFVTTRVASLALDGTDVGGMLLGRGVRARRALIDSLLVDVTNDRHLPLWAGVPRRRRTPQEWIADLNGTIRLDTVLVQRSKVVYRMHRADRDLPGVMTFARLEALAVGVNTAAAAAATRDPMRLDVTTYLQNSGRMTATFVVPLRAPRFEMTYRGTLGPMRAYQLNSFIQETQPFRIADGQVTGIDFAGTVSHGISRGSITPRYHDLSIAVTDEAKGVLGRPGFFGKVARKVVSFAGNFQKVNGWNPDEVGRTPRVGAIRHTFTTNETLPAFLWTGLREGLLDVIRR